MDPLSALIGGGLSLVGGLMNASSTQSINAANLQNQMWSAQGGYLPGLVQNANKAGLNPLAVLGSRGPNMAVQVGTQPGAGLEQAGRQISQVDAQAHELALQGAREDVANKAATNKNLMIRNAVDLEIQRRLEANPDWVPAGFQERKKDTELGASAIDTLKSWNNNTPPISFNPNAPIPKFFRDAQSWDWRKWLDNMWSDSGETFRR